MILRRKVSDLSNDKVPTETVTTESTTSQKESSATNEEKVEGVPGNKLGK